MAEEHLTNTVETQFYPILEVLASDIIFQIALILIASGMILITLIHYKFSKWIDSKEITYTNTHYSHIIKATLFPMIGVLVLVAGIIYIQYFELFTNEIYIQLADASPELTPREFFAKVLHTILILVLTLVISKIILVVFNKREKSSLEYQDFKAWKEMRGFEDDNDNLFYKLFKWTPPSVLPQGMKQKDFQEFLSTNDGRKKLERYRTNNGLPIGSYEPNVKNPFDQWKKAEQLKYEKYLKDCLSGNNHAGRKLRLGPKLEEVYTIETWRDIKRLENYDPIVPGGKPPGHSKGKVLGTPNSFKRALSIGIFFSVVIGVFYWWNVDIVVLATASGGLSIGMGLALKGTAENYFAYLQIRKNGIINEGDRIEIEGYNGYVHKITPSVTFVKHGLHESLGIFPTHQLVASKIINFTKDFKIVPAKLEIGVSYIHDPEQVASILVKIGNQIMVEARDSRGRHIVVQERCPNLDKNLASCGCDKELLVDIEQPTVRFTEYGDSALKFELWVFVRDYGSQFKVKSLIRMMIYKEFKKYGIKIPYPIRTNYEGNEENEIKQDVIFQEEREKVIKEFGIGDLDKTKEEED